MIKSFFHKMSYRQKLLYIQICSIVIIIFIMGAAMSAVLSDTIRKNEEEHLERLLQVVNENISGQMEAFSSVSFDLLVSDTLKENLNQTDSIKYGRAFIAIQDILGTKTIGTIGLSSIVVIDQEKHVYSSNIGLILPKDFELEETEVFKAAQSQPGELVWLTENDIYNLYGTEGPYKNTSDIHAASVIRDYVQDRTYGILILSLNNQFFQNMTFSDKELEGTRLYLVSPDKKKKYKISGTEEDLETDILSELDFSEKAAGIYTSKSKVISYRYNKTMKWFLVSITDSRTLKSWFYQVVPALIAVLLIGAIIFSAVSNRFLKTMTRGIDALVAGMRRVEQGDFEITVENSTSDEIGQLTSVFNHMVKQINELIILKYRQELLTQRAEFKVLQAQINPHFLYNILDMLNWQLVIRGEEDLSNSVIAIGNLLRYSMSRDQMNVLLKDEMENINDYLSVQYSISGKEILYSMDVEEAEKIWLPRLSLQPLIENTITHGFEGRDKNNILRITGRKGIEDGQEVYVMTIEDNGIGMSREQLEQLENLYEPETSSHVGIANVRKRISYLYNKKAEMRFESQYGYGTTITIKLPVQSIRREGNGYEAGNRG